MINWKLNRKQKLIRNLIVTVASLGILWWMLDFPALTFGGLLRRAEQAYLLDERGEILYSDSWLDGGRILSLHGDRLMSILSIIAIVVGVFIALSHTATNWVATACGFALIYAAVAGFISEKAFRG